MTPKILTRLNGRSIRLALSYLAIIMVLCIGFSVVFYITATSGLSLKLSSDKEHNQALTLQASGGVSSNSISTPPDKIADVPQLNAQLQQQFQAVRSELTQRLVLFNFGALLGGSFFSYYLARRTLRPIEGAMAAQARFSSDASHELRTPLAALRVQGEVALRNQHLTVSKARAVIRSNVEQAQKLEQLANGLLRLSRQDGVLIVQAVSLEEIANEAMNALISKAQAKHIVIEESVPHVCVLGDRQGLVQVLIILLDNAIKYSAHGSTVRLGGDINDRHGLLYVRDTGLGIAANDLPHIFDRLFRADTSRSQQGYGLGLSIAQKIIEQQKGTISVKSSLGEGSLFTIKLPLAQY